jgi:hypothetical protein
MKVLIKENKLFDSIYKYIDESFEQDEIDWVYGIDYDPEGNEDIEDENFLIFYKGDWEGEEDSDIIFYYLDVEYYSDEPSSKPFKDEAPILDVTGEYSEHLDTMFGDHWKEPMKKWFQDNFNLPVNTVSTYSIDNDDYNEDYEIMALRIDHECPYAILLVGRQNAVVQEACHFVLRRKAAVPLTSLFIADKVHFIINSIRCQFVYS